MQQIIWWDLPTTPCRPSRLYVLAGAAEIVTHLVRRCSQVFLNTVSPGCFQRLAQQLVQVSAHRKKKPKTLNQTHGISLVTGLFTTGASRFYFWTSHPLSSFLLRCFHSSLTDWGTSDPRTKPKQFRHQGCARICARRKKRTAQKRVSKTVVRKPSAYARSLNTHQN